MGGQVHRCPWQSQKGSYGGRGGGKQQSLNLAYTSGEENENAKLPKVQELSYRANNKYYSDD